MQRTELKYFACANSCKGFVDYFPDILREMNRIFILKGGPGTGKSTLMKRIGGYFANQGEPVEHIYCSSDPSSLDGVILRNRGIAVVDGTAPHVVEPKAPGAVEEYVNLGISWNRERLVPHRGEILDLQEKIGREFASIYATLRESQKVYTRWAGIYQEYRSEEKLSHVFDHLEKELFVNHPFLGEKPRQIHRFSAALTREGMLHYTENLTEGVPNRYFVKGAPGTGKAKLLSEMLRCGTERGLEAEVYHSPLDAERLSMVIFREAGVCILDAMPPWESFPAREGDVMIDLYASGVVPQTEDDHREVISLLRREYEETMQEAETCLARVKHLHDALEEYYIHAVDFGQIEELTEDLILEIE